MKRLIVLMLAICTCLLAGCRSGSNDAGQSTVSDAPPAASLRQPSRSGKPANEKDGVVLTVDDLDAAGDVAQITLTNQSDRTLYTGYAYVLSEQDDLGKWQTVDLGILFRDILVTLEPDQKTQSKLSKALLTAGRTYKIEKNFRRSEDGGHEIINVVFDAP